MTTARQTAAALQASIETLGELSQMAFKADANSASGLFFAALQLNSRRIDAGVPVDRDSWLQLASIPEWRSGTEASSR